jgi:Lrp/AsnC family leucine-responsive transcriptional regulator
MSRPPAPVPLPNPSVLAVLDATDWTALRVLQAGGRLSWSDLAAVLELSPAATAERVRRLEERGVITGYRAVVAPAAVHADLLAFVEVTLAHPRHRAGFLRTVLSRDEILECHHVTGEFDYLLKVRCRDAAHLNALIGDELKGMGAALRSRTMIALGTAKESSALPLGEPAAGRVPRTTRGKGAKDARPRSAR